MDLFIPPSYYDTPQGLHIFIPVLDPHISLEGLLHDAEQDSDSDSQIKHIHECRALLEHHFREHYVSRTVTGVQPTANAARPPSSPVDFDPYSRYRQNFRSKISDSSDELERYFRLNPADAHELGVDAITWWRDHKGAFPNLSRLARDIFSIPGKLTAHTIFLPI